MERLMLTKEENEYLCRIGPDTPMGNVVRRYWTPVCLASDLPHPDCPPKVVRLFAENYVVFRDSNAALGMLDEKCCHRGASLGYGRVEDCGIRCLYHGWKFAVDGTIQETPNYPDSRFRQRIKAPAFPVRERGGLVWAYVGPPDKEPAFPEYFWLGDGTADSQPVVFLTFEQCNWIQAIENGIDSSHVGILHQDLGAVPEFSENLPQAAEMDHIVDDAPKLEVENTGFGFHYAALRRTASQGGDLYARVTAWVAPYMNYIPPHGASASLRVPVDDTMTAVYMVKPAGAGYEDPDRRRRFTGLGAPGDEPWYGQDRVLHIPPQDRAAMARGESFTGFTGVNVQDAAMYVSQGPIYDRSREHLVPADVAVLRMRRLLIDSARRVEAGGDPIGLDVPVETSRIQAGSGMVSPGTSWTSLVPGNYASRETSRP
jgi:phthalate 4,5-dioxygenase